MLESSSYKANKEISQFCLYFSSVHWNIMQMNGPVDVANL